MAQVNWLIKKLEQNSQLHSSTSTRSGLEATVKWIGDENRDETLETLESESLVVLADSTINLKKHGCLLTNGHQ